MTCLSKNAGCSKGFEGNPHRHLQRSRLGRHPGSWRKCSMAFSTTYAWRHGASSVAAKNGYVGLPSERPQNEDPQNTHRGVRDFPERGLVPYIFCRLFEPLVLVEGKRENHQAPNHITRVARGKLKYYIHPCQSDDPSRRVFAPVSWTLGHLEVMLQPPPPPFPPPFP